MTNPIHQYIDNDQEFNKQLGTVIQKLVNETEHQHEIISDLSNILQEYLVRQQKLLSDMLEATKNAN